jgi:glutaredoxin
MNNEEKQCSKCKNTYKATKDYFPYDSRSKDGFSSHCRNCAREALRVSSRKRQAKAKGLSLKEYDEMRIEQKLNTEANRKAKQLEQQNRKSVPTIIVNGRFL